MPAVTMPAHKKGDYLVDYEEKVFKNVKAKPGEKALITFHTVAFEGSIGLVNTSGAASPTQRFQDHCSAVRTGRYARCAARISEAGRRTVSGRPELR